MGSPSPPFTPSACEKAAGKCLLPPHGEAQSKHNTNGPIRVSWASTWRRESSLFWADFQPQHLLMPGGGGGAGELPGLTRGMASSAAMAPPPSRPIPFSRGTELGLPTWLKVGDTERYDNTTHIVTSHKQHLGSVGGTRTAGTGP